MSKITTIYDNLGTLIEAALTSHRRLANPYVPSDNNKLMLDKGYGIGFGPSTNTERQLSCQMSIERTMNIIFTKKVTTTTHNTTAQGTLEKAMMEDTVTFLTALEADADLSGAASKTVYLGDSGVELLEGENSSHLLIQVDVNVEYFEDLT